MTRSAKHKPDTPKPERWLWWLIPIIIFASAALLALIHTEYFSVLDAAAMTRLIVVATVIAVGIVIIAATARFWVQR